MELSKPDPGSALLDTVTAGYKALFETLRVPGIDPTGLSDFVGRNVITRTVSNQVWVGTLAQKDGNEVILHGARKLRQWQLAKGIALPSTVLYGLAAVNHSSNQISQVQDIQWLQICKMLPLPDEIYDQVMSAPETRMDL